MRSVLLALLLALSACAPIEIRPRAEATRAICGFEPMPPEAPALFDGVAPSEPCAERIRRDFEAKGDVGTLVAGAALLLAMDLGTVDASGDWAGPAWADALEVVAAETGGTEVAGLLYDYAVARFTGVGTGDCNHADAATNVITGRLTWCAEEASPIDAAALIVHEARHRDGFDHVACDDDPRAICDEGRQGAVGFQASVYERTARVVDLPETVEALEWRIELLAERVVP